MSEKETVQELPKVTALKGPKVHTLGDGEKQLLQTLNIMVLNAKGKIFDFQIALEAAQKELASAQAGLNAALAAIGASNGIQTPQLSADFQKITGASVQP